MQICLLLNVILATRGSAPKRPLGALDDREGVHLSFSLYFSLEGGGKLPKNSINLSCIYKKAYCKGEVVARFLASDELTN